MAWKEETAMSIKKRFISCVLQEEVNFSAICKAFQISRECGYKWLKRYRESGEKGLEELSRKPLLSPFKTSDVVEDQILAVREKHQAWGARKIYAFLKRKGVTNLPTPSTITRILHRHGKIEEGESIRHTAFMRFEHAKPNQLWQMDFKGQFWISSGQCHPLTVLDDHSRYSLDIRACANQQAVTVKTSLINIFREYGLPERMTMDNGSPWGSPSEKNGYTGLEVWLIRLGIYVSHSRPFHPQTQGKDERFHRSLKAELLRGKSFANLESIQKEFDEWRWCYNHERPHEALKLNSPASRYQVSSRKYPESLPVIAYDIGSEVRRVAANGEMNYKGEKYYISESMKGLPVKIVESNRCGILNVYLDRQKVKEIDLINKRVAKKIV